MKTKRDKLDNCHAAYLAQKEGRRPRPEAKDGGVPTHPVVDCPDLPELGKSGVQDLCVKWLRARRILCDPHACGRGPGEARYGIKDSGDIHGYLPPDGRGFEIECKRGRGGRQSKGQQRRMKRVREAGGVYFVVHGIPELEYYMRGLI